MMATDDRRSKARMGDDCPPRRNADTCASRREVDNPRASGGRGGCATRRGGVAAADLGQIPCRTHDRVNVGWKSTAAPEKENHRFGRRADDGGGRGRKYSCRPACARLDCGGTRRRCHRAAGIDWGKRRRRRRHFREKHALVRGERAALGASRGAGQCRRRASARAG